MLMARRTPCVSNPRRIGRWFVAAIALACASVMGARSQSTPADVLRGSKPQQPYLDFVHKMQQENASPAKLGYAWALLASSYQDSGDLDEALRAYNHALSLLGKSLESRANFATALDNAGEVYLELGRSAEAEEVRMKAFRIRTELEDPIDIARSHEHLAEVLLAQHQFKRAEEHAQATVNTLTEMREPNIYKVVPTEGMSSVRKHGNTLLSAYVTLTYAQCLQAEFEACLQSAHMADDIVTHEFTPVSLERAHVDMALGFAQWKSGDIRAAEPKMQSGISLMKATLGEAHPVSIESMVEYRDFLKSTHRKQDAAIQDRAIQTALTLHPAGSCNDCTVSVFAMR